MSGCSKQRRGNHKGAHLERQGPPGPVEGGSEIQLVSEPPGEFVKMLILSNPPTPDSDKSVWDGAQETAFRSYLLAKSGSSVKYPSRTDP